MTNNLRIGNHVMSLASFADLRVKQTLAIRK